MKLSCDIIRDLLPLYEDEVCSEDSKKAVQEHLQSCPHCRAYHQRMRGNLGEEIVETVETQQNQSEAEAIKKSFRKVNHYWLRISTILVSLCLLVSVGVFYLLSRGLTPENWQAIQRAEQYLQYLQQGEYEQAAEQMEAYYRDYQELIQQLYHLQLGEYQKNTQGAELSEQLEIFRQCYAYELSLEQEEYVAYRRDSFVRMMESYSEQAQIGDSSFESAQYGALSWGNANEQYYGTSVTFSIKECFAGDEQEYEGTIVIFVTEDSAILRNVSNEAAVRAGYQEQALDSYVHSTVRGMYGSQFGIGLWREDTER